jgi:hypothetical protein
MPAACAAALTHARPPYCAHGASAAPSTAACFSPRGISRAHVSGQPSVVDVAANTTQATLPQGADSNAARQPECANDAADHLSTATAKPTQAALPQGADSNSALRPECANDACDPARPAATAMAQAALVQAPSGTAQGPPRGVPVAEPHPRAGVVTRLSTRLGNQASAGEGVAAAGSCPIVAAAGSCPIVAELSPETSGSSAGGAGSPIIEAGASSGEEPVGRRIVLVFPE